MEDEVRFKRMSLAEQDKQFRLFSLGRQAGPLDAQAFLGNSIAVWKDGKAVIIPPEEITLSSEFFDGVE